jgi:hypothetical protein
VCYGLHLWAALLERERLVCYVSLSSFLQLVRISMRCAVDRQAKPKKRFNADQKRALLSEQLKLLAKQAGRRAQKRKEPNDRSHDREVEQMAKRMNPVSLDRLLRDGDD